MNLKQYIRRNFRRRAATYDRHAQVQRYMGAQLLARCAQEIAAADRILEVGCGTGFLTRELRRLNRRGWLLAVDLDPDLLAQARKHLKADPGIAWLAADAESLTRGTFDLIVANSVFQWFATPEETLRRYVGMLASGGCLAFSAMGPGTFQELGEAWREAAAGLNLDHWPRPAAGNFLDWQEWAGLLRAAGYREVQTEQAVVVASYPSVRDLLKGIQETGATNPKPHPFSPRLYQRLLAVYQERFGNGTIPATYDLIWAMARK